MRLCHVVGLSILGAGFLAAQKTDFPVNVGTGLVVAGDFNADGVDDVLVIGRDLSGSCQTFFGRKSAPYFVPGPGWSFPQWWDISDAPLFHGGCLYIPVNIRFQSVTEIQRYRIVNGAWASMGRAGIYLSTTRAGVNSLKICRSARDLNGDKQPDIVAVWGEAILQKGRTFHAAYVSPVGLHGEVAVPPVPGQPNNAEVADVHPSRSFGTAGGAEEYIVILSGPYLWAFSGVGILTLGKNLAPGKGLFGAGVPPANFGGQTANISACCYGRFGRNRNFATPLLHLQTGEAMIVDPGYVAPYLSNTGEVLHSTAQALFLDEATADYDGDGVDEVVLVENYPSPTATLVYIGGPTTRRKYAQVYNLAQTGRRSLGAKVYHGTKGDFNGDGHVDLLLSYDVGGKGFFALFLARRGRPGTPALRRVH